MDLTGFRRSYRDFDLSPINAYGKMLGRPTKNGIRWTSWRRFVPIATHIYMRCVVKIKGNIGLVGTMPCGGDELLRLHVVTQLGHKRGGIHNWRRCEEVSGQP